MEKVRVAINGFCRIGRLALRILVLKDNIEIVAVNSVIPSECSYLIKNDSIHGRLAEKVDYGEDWISVNDKKILALQERDPSKLPWKEMNIDVVIESTGAFTTMEGASQHIQSGAKFAVISAPSKDVPMFVMGVNHDQYNGQSIVSNASCTTNCLAPLVYILNEHFGIEEGLMSTIHSATATQRPVDSCMKGSDRRRGRTAFNNIIPTSTGADIALSIVYPKVAGRIVSTSYRVPITNVSMVDLVVKLEKPCKSKEEMDELMKSASESEKLRGIFGYSDEKLVSSDFIHDSRSSIYDTEASVRLSDKFFKLVCWYDNEWGYANRLVDLLEYIVKYSKK